MMIRQTSNDSERPWGFCSSCRHFVHFGHCAARAWRVTRDDYCVEDYEPRDPQS